MPRFRVVAAASEVRRQTTRLLACSPFARPSLATRNSISIVTTAATSISSKNDDGVNSSLADIVDDRGRQFSIHKLQFAARQVISVSIS